MFQKNIHKVKFYPSADDFTQAPLVMLVTNIMSVVFIIAVIIMAINDGIIIIKVDPSYSHSMSLLMF